MIWGCFSAYGIGSYCKTDGTMDGELYQQILHEDFMWTIRDQEFDVRVITFQQDGASYLTAKPTKCWLIRNKIKFFDWPPNYPTSTQLKTCGMKLTIILGISLNKLQVRQTSEKKFR